MISSKIFETLDLSDEFWAQFGVPNPLKKQVGLYELESIDNANILTIAINPKVCFENIKRKVLTKNTKC